MKLLVTMDTEEDDAWGRTRPFRTENVRFLPRFQGLCERHGLKPTWLCTAPILEDPRFADAIGPAVESGRAEVGVHLHPWSCPPFREDELRNPPIPEFPHELPIEVFRGKIAHLVERARAAFGRPPACYRAGRWGFAEPQVPILLELGLRVDCSVTPHQSWRRLVGRPDGRGGPDFRSAPLVPYWIDPADVRRPGDSRLLELPMTVLHPKGPFAGRPETWRILQRWESALPSQLLGRVGWAPILFRPWPGRPVKTLLQMADCARRLGLPYIMLMLHSSELMPGGSPYFPDEPAVERLHALLEALFDRLERSGVGGATLSEFARPLLADRP